jgi:hypothetical protein
MLKAFTPVAVLLFSFFSGLEKTSLTELYIVTIICIGKKQQAMSTGTLLDALI